MRHELLLPAVFSAPSPSDAALDPRLPPGYKLVRHQADVYLALADPELDVVIDVAMTGDGKSLAAFLPLFLPHGKAGLRGGVYACPTNELIRDQEKQWARFQREFGVGAKAFPLFGDSLAAFATELDVRKRAALEAIFQENEILLTNPDMFHLIMHFFYVHDWKVKTSLAMKFSASYSLFVFDEFHIFQAPQIVAVINALNFLKLQRKKHFPVKFLFLSATPRPLLEEMLEESGLRVKVVRGAYAYGVRPGPDWRPILQAVRLRLEANEESIVSWLENGWREILDFFQKNPGSKGAVICNSVFSAKKAVALLREKLAPWGISVGENTGLTGEAMRAASFEADLLVGTATVDVGVDFRINLLVFESLDAGTFVQRLGRMGRHDGYLRAGEKIAFSDFLAIALLPPFIVERFIKRFPESAPVERETLNHSVAGYAESEEDPIFPMRNDFPRYRRRWGVYSALYMVDHLAHPQVRDTNETLLRCLIPAFKRLYGISDDQSGRRYAGLKRKQPFVSQELLSFRGYDPLRCWLWDEEEDSILYYDLFRLLSGVDFTLLSRSEAEAVAKRLGKPFEEAFLYLRVLGYRDRTPFRLRYAGSFLEAGEAFGMVQERKGFYVDAYPHREIGEVNKRLETVTLVTTAVREDGKTVRFKYRLPALFGIYPVMDREGVEATVAFGKDALLLDSECFFRDRQKEVSWIV